MEWARKTVNEADHEQVVEWLTASFLYGSTYKLDWQTEKELKELYEKREKGVGAEGD